MLAVKNMAMKSEDVAAFRNAQTDKGTQQVPELTRDRQCEDLGITGRVPGSEMPSEQLHIFKSIFRGTTQFFRLKLSRGCSGIFDACVLEMSKDFPQSFDLLGSIKMICFCHAKDDTL